MQIDIVSIFPDYFAPLELSLIGKAIHDGLVDLKVHDLRVWTHDRHRTVDDTPYGGGAGMVMKPEPWGECFDYLIENHAKQQNPKPLTVVFPTPSGTPFTQQIAEELSNCQNLVFACGRYEGIDRRVIDWVETQTQVYELSLGDYVLNGGEVAALAMIEAIVRLIPGVLGNPESLVEESYSNCSAGLLEYPVYTKPSSWRGLDVPDVLLSGHHENVADWRKKQSLKITQERRPDLLTGN